MDHFTSKNHTKKQCATLNSRYLDHKHNALRRNFIPLPKEEWLKIVVEPCYYCGEILTSNIALSTNYKRNGTGQDCIDNYEVKMNGVDRVENSIGYELNNCIPCCVNCNKMKNDLTPQEFLQHLRLIYENKQS